ncbi:MAG: hypothetical protein OSB00_02900 [Sphingomonas bacterium]|nr:hypothetical protein [Sphingomonas bacterium]
MTISMTRIATALAGAAMIVTPVAASAAPANAATSLSVTRAATQTKDGNKFAGIGGTTAINIAILAAIVVGVLVATGGSDDDNGAAPASP